MQPDIDLSGLRGVESPVAPSFFPPAVGWWIVSAAGVVVLALIGYWVYRWYSSPKQYAFRVLKKIEEQDLTIPQTGVQLGVLLKRVALLKFQREEVASLSDASWAEFLIKHGGGALTKEQAFFISSAAYLPQEKAVAIQKEKLYTAVKEWINKILTEV